MQSNLPVPGDPWPHDMVIRVSDDDPFLTGLLLVRAAWRLQIEGVPHLDDAVNVNVSGRPEGQRSVDLERDWMTDWKLAWQRYDDESTHKLSATLAVRFWGESAIWREGIDAASQWYWRAAVEGSDRHLRWDETPEHQSLPALVHAWKHGLTTIIQLPYAGPYAARLNRGHLVVSRHTRMDRELYSEALLAI
jgi:hypothetical protein